MKATTPEQYAKDRATCTVNATALAHPSLQNYSKYAIKQRIRWAKIEYTRRGNDLYIREEDRERATSLLTIPVNQHIPQELRKVDA